MKISIAAAAESELIASVRFYAQQSNVELGFAFIAEFERSVELLRMQPKLGAPWRGSNRRMPLRRFPNSIVYLLLPEEIRALAIAHQRRKPGYWSGGH